jgi:hypothetical protein
MTLNMTVVDAERLAAVKAAGVDVVDNTGPGTFVASDGAEYTALDDWEGRAAVRRLLRARPTLTPATFIARHTGLKLNTVVDLVTTLKPETADYILSEAIYGYGGIGLDAFTEYAVQAFGIAHFIGTEYRGKHGRFGVYRTK